MKSFNKNRLFKILAVCAIALPMVGCGASSDNIDILNSSAFPEINNFSTTTLTSGAFGSAYTTETPYWIFNSGGYGSYLSPAKGFVAEIGASNIITGGSYVSIVHSGRMMTRVHGIQTLNVRPGDAVLSGSIVGGFITTTQIAFQVFVDNVAVCPLSYMSMNFRNSFAVGNYNPCR